MTRLAFLTGASSGIGQAMALALANKAYRLALVTRRPQELDAWARAQGLKAQSYEIYAADLRDPSSVVEAGLRCMSSQGLPDLVVASAGISVGMDSSQRADLEVMAETFAINNTGMAATFHPFIQAMKERGTGTLVGIASVAGIRGLPGHGAYCASKAGVIQYCESLRCELAASGISVVTILPGYIDTPMTRKNKYKMPFLMTADKFAQNALRVIEKGGKCKVIPWQMAMVAPMMRCLPDSLYDRLVQGRPRKQRRE